MTTDWREFFICSRIKPKYYTENMKECFVYDNPNGRSIRELMFILSASHEDILRYFDEGLEKYKKTHKKGGQGTYAQRNSKMV